jgi:hypothetical protein
MEGVVSMVMEREMDGDDGGGATVPLSSHKMDLRSVQLFLWRLSCLRRLYCKLYIGAFTKIAWIDLTKTVAGGMGARYGQALPIPVLTRPFDAWFRDLFDLRELTTHKFSLIILNFDQKVSKFAKKKEKKDLHIFAIISH